MGVSDVLPIFSLTDGLDGEALQLLGVGQDAHRVVDLSTGKVFRRRSDGEWENVSSESAEMSSGQYVPQGTRSSFVLWCLVLSVPLCLIAASLVRRWRP